MRVGSACTRASALMRGFESNPIRDGCMIILSDDLFDCKYSSGVYYNACVSLCMYCIHSLYVPLCSSTEDRCLRGRDAPSVLPDVGDQDGVNFSMDRIKH